MSGWPIQTLSGRHGCFNCMATRPSVQSMRKIDIQAVLKNLPAGGFPIRPVAEVQDTVAEYASTSIAKEFAMFPATWNRRVGQTKNLIFAAEQLLSRKRHCRCPE